MKPLLLPLVLLVPVSLAWTSQKDAPADPKAKPVQREGRSDEDRGGPPPAETQIKDHVDGVVRWMRSQQDRATGAYGDPETTAWVLWALGDSPRKYRPGDGFFVRGAFDFLVDHQLDSGAFAKDKKTADVKFTQLVTRAMYGHVDAGHKQAYGKALAWLGGQGIADPRAGLIEEGLPEDAARKHIRQLVAQSAGNHWKAPVEGKTDLLVTAKNVVDLSRYAKMFAVQEAQAPIVPLGPFTSADRDKVLESMHKGAAFLVAVAEDGKFGAPGRPDAGLTSMVIGALQNMPTPREPKVQKIIDNGLVWLASLQKPDGSIHQGMLANYVTSASVMALSKSSLPAHKDAVMRAQAFLIGLQADEGEGYSEGDRYYGGIGYGGDERPDLSNLQMALDALNASGLPKDHPAYQRAILFAQRCQNRSESNDIAIQDGDVIITSGNDGGSAYMPGNSKAGTVTLENGNQVPRSYGSMTYALLKSYVLAGLEKDDPRVKAAFEWVQKNYTLDINPGFDTSRDARAAYQGLFYYFLSMSRALNAIGVDELVDGQGQPHAWKRELAGRLIAMQSKESGSWSNQNAPRWWEGNPILGTAYALSVLGETLR